MSSNPKSWHLLRGRPGAFGNWKAPVWHPSMKPSSETRAVYLTQHTNLVHHRLAKIRRLVRVFLYFTNTRAFFSSRELSVKDIHTEKEPKDQSNPNDCIGEVSIESKAQSKLALLPPRTEIHWVVQDTPFSDQDLSQTSTFLRHRNGAYRYFNPIAEVYASLFMYSF